jgi:hypothetical protein
VHILLFPVVGERLLNFCTKMVIFILNCFGIKIHFLFDFCSYQGRCGKTDSSILILKWFVSILRAGSWLFPQFLCRVNTSPTSPHPSDLPTTITQFDLINPINYPNKA